MTATQTTPTQTGIVPAGIVVSTGIVGGPKRIFIGSLG